MVETVYFEASKAIYSAALNCLQDERGVHAETAVAAVSAICGEELLRACHVDLTQFPQGGIVLVDQVNDSGPRMLGYLEQLLDDLAVEHSDDWSKKIPSEHHPQRDPLKLAHELRPHLQSLFSKHGLNEEQAAYATCMALAYLIRDCQNVLPAAVSVTIAYNVLVRAAKSVPLQ
jgi:hypothetical protein